MTFVNKNQNTRYNRRTQLVEFMFVTCNKTLILRLLLRHC